MNPSTVFWQLAPLVLQIIQMIAYISAIRKYKGKLEDLADWLCECADKEAEKYMSFRDCDPDFYAYYKTLPDYEVCDSAIKRNKGESFYNYGANLRRRIRTVRGYNKFAKVHWNNMLSAQAINEAAVARAVTCIRERRRRNNHILERWSAIVSAPVAVERYQASIINGVVQSSFNSLKGYSRGFNSAGAAFGTSLFRILN